MRYVPGFGSSSHSHLVCLKLTSSLPPQAHLRLASQPVCPLQYSLWSQRNRSHMSSTQKTSMAPHYPRNQLRPIWTASPPPWPDPTHSSSGPCTCYLLSGISSFLAPAHLSNSLFMKQSKFSSITAFLTLLALPVLCS